MFNETLINAIISLSPFWTNDIIKLFNLGNEYSMAINLIIGQVLKFITPYLTDNICIGLICIACCYLILVKLNLDIFNLTNYFKGPKQITIIAYEQKQSNTNNAILVASNTFKTICSMLITKYHLDNIKLLNDGFENIEVLDVIKNFKLETDLYLNVIHNGEQIIIKLTTYKLNLKKIVSDALESDQKQNDNKLKFYGTELNGFFDYPESMMILNYVLINIYNIQKLKVCQFKQIQSNIFSQKTNTEKTNTENNTENKTDLEDENQLNSEKIKSNIKKIYIIENCKDFLIENEIYLDVERYGSNTIYILHTKDLNIDLKVFFEKIINIYIKHISKPDYVYKTQLIGYETKTLHGSQFIMNFGKVLLALIDNLIKNKYVNNYRIIDNTQSSIIKIIDADNIDVDDIKINIIKKIIKTHNYITTIHTFILESNTVDIEKYLTNILKIYEESLLKERHSTLYYFKYNGIDKKTNEFEFTKHIISEQQNPSFETFDNIFSEHSDMLKKDLMRLNDFKYYQNTGMRRKKSYLFYGEPGTGKNAMVTAMALHDNRHILDISFDLIKTNSELNKLLNLESIHNINFKRSQIIIMFDEFHIGLNKIMAKLNPINRNPMTMVNSICNKIEKFTSSDECEVNETFTNDDEINIGEILSMFDGSLNYNGLIIVALTNYIDKIYEPLKRPNRLTPIYFTYMRNIDVINLLEKYYKITLNSDQIKYIPDRKITPVVMRLLCEKYENNLNELLEEFNREYMGEE